MIYILFYLLPIFLCNILYLIRYYDMKIIIFWILARKNKVKNIKYINTLDIDEIKKILQLKTKGKFIEYYVATNAWKPIISLESCDNEEWLFVKNNFIYFINKLKKNHELLSEIVNKNLTEYIRNKNTVIDSSIISKIICISFCDFLFDHKLSEYQVDLLYQSSLEWRKEIALKGKGDMSIKLEAINIILELIKLNNEVYSIFKDKWDQPEYYSVIMQPFIISPMINIADIMCNYQTLIRKGAVTTNDKITFDLIDKIIYSYHPFPILERYDIITNTQYFIPLDVLTNYKNFNENSKFLSFGYGPRKCAGSQYTYKIMEVLLSEYNKNTYLFNPEKNHKYSGRINDKFNLYETLYMLYKLFFFIYE